MHGKAEASVWNGILIITLSGEYRKDEAVALSEQVLQHANGAGRMPVLVDARLLKGRMEFGSLYFHVGQLAEKSPRLANRAAVVELKENSHYADFHETISANVGVAIKYFFDYDEAIAWLQSESPDS
jgi:hypothetical protein